MRDPHNIPLIALFCPLHSLAAQGENLIVSPLAVGTMDYRTQTKQTQNSVTAYVADASTVKQLKPQHGAALCSVPENWCVFMVTPVIYLTEMTCLKCSQLCNKCGLFERTHGIPRPKKFPRRRRAHSTKAMPPPSVHPNARTVPNGAAVNPHIQDIQSPTSPGRTHLVHAFDPMSGEIFPQHAPWISPDGSDPSPARISRCYTASQQATLYHASRQSPPSALTDPMWI